MPSKTSEVINCLPDIEGKTYLELGVNRGGTFSHIKAKSKEGVEIRPGRGPATYTMSTDEFFENDGPACAMGIKFDIIYIDADHMVDQVVRDFNNSVRWLSGDGVLFVHDLWPRSEKYTAPNLSGDGYKILWRKLSYPTFAEHDELIFICTQNEGLTIFINPQPVKFGISDEVRNATYLHMKAAVERNWHLTRTHNDLCLMMKNIRDIIPSW